MLVAVALISACAMTACGDDDDDDEPGSSSGKGIVGEWLLTSTKGWEKENGTITDEWNEGRVNDFCVLKFRSNGTFEHYDDGLLKDRGTYTYKGDKLTIKYTEEEDGEEYSQTSTCKISGDTMRVTYHETETEDGIKYEFYGEYTYTRLDD